MSGIRNDVIVRRLRQRQPHSFCIARVRKMTSFSARQSCTGTLTFFRPSGENVNPSAGAATTAALMRGSAARAVRG